MWRRVRIYLIGVVLGLLLTWALVLRHRNTEDLLAWTPNNRILEVLRQDSNLVKPDHFACLLGCYDISTLEYEALLADGEVDFGRSITRETPRKYLVEHTLEDGRSLSMWFTMSEKQNALTEFYIGEEPKTCACP